MTNEEFLKKFNTTIQRPPRTPPISEFKLDMIRTGFIQMQWDPAKPQRSYASACEKKMGQITLKLEDVRLFYERVCADIRAEEKAKREAEAAAACMSRMWDPPVRVIIQRSFFDRFFGRCV